MKPGPVETPKPKERHGPGPITLIIGSSGFLGRVVTDRLHQDTPVVPTHFQNPAFPHSVPFDLFQDDAASLPEARDVSTVIFCAGVEQDNDAPFVERAMKRLLNAFRNKRFVYLSSDAIFAGDRGSYREDETPAPRTPYGRNLLHCETLVRERCPDHLIVRPSYLYGFSQGRLDPRLARTVSAARAGETVTFFDDMFKSPLGVQQVAQAVADLSRSSVTGTLHVAGPRLSVYAFHLLALQALAYDTRTLIGKPMPETFEAARDTSLDSSRWQRLSGTRALSVAETLSGSARHPAAPNVSQHEV